MSRLVDETDRNQEDVAPGAGRSMVPTAYLVVAVLVAAACAILAVIALGDNDSSSTSDRSDEGARAAAAEYATTFLSLDYAALDSWRAELETVATPTFADQLDEVASALGELSERTETVWRGQVVDVYVGVVDGPSVAAVVRYDLTVTSNEGTRQLSDHYLRIDLVRGDQGWLIDSVTTLTLGSAPGAGDLLGPGESTGAPAASTTTVP